MSPRLTVVMSVCNGSRYLGEAIDSVLAQTFGDFRFIIVDDASTDDSPGLLRGYAERDPRIQILSNPENVGLTASLNRALAGVESDFIARMDADDICMPDRLSRQVAYLDANPACVVVGCRILSIDEDGDPLYEENQATSHEGIETVLFHGYGGAIPHPTATMRMQAFRECGGYSEDFPVAQDLDLWLRMAEKGRLANLPDVLLKYRRHFSAIGWQRQGEQRDVAEAILRATYLRRQLPVPSDLRAHFLPRPSAHVQRLEWSRRAAYHGYARSAWKHAWRAIKEEPRDVAAWRTAIRVGVYACGLRRSAAYKTVGMTA